MSSKQWLSYLDITTFCDLTAKELDAAAKKARADILKNAKPIPKGTTPTIVVTVGAPGSGKSTVGKLVAESYANNFISIDLDLAVKYHPRFNNLWNFPDALTGKATGVGIIETHNLCTSELSGMMEVVIDEIIAMQKYNIILQAYVSMKGLKQFSMKKYNVVALCVGVPLKIAQERAWSRSLKTGQFFERTRAEQNEFIKAVWSMYPEDAMWDSLLVDEVLVVSNKNTTTDPKQLKKFIMSSLQRFDPHKCVPGNQPKKWLAPLAEIRRAIHQSQK